MTEEAISFAVRWELSMSTSSSLVELRTCSNSTVRCEDHLRPAGSAACRAAILIFISCEADDDEEKPS
jgi:hypothetical protein